MRDWQNHDFFLIGVVSSTICDVKKIKMIVDIRESAYGQF